MIDQADPAVFWAMVGAIAQVLGSIATLAAVAVALILARGERTIRLRVSADFRTIFSLMMHEDVMCLTVENVGHRTARVEGIFWSTGFRKPLIRLPAMLALKGAFQLDDYSWEINPKFPWVIEPGHSKSTFMKRQEFLDGFQRHHANDLFRKFPWSKRWTLFNHKVGVNVTTMPKMYLGSVSRDLTEALEAAYELNN